MAQIQMLDDDNPADFEWIVLADGGARDAFEIELEATRKFLSIPNGQWAVHYYEKGGANVLCQVRCILEKHPVQISGRPRVFWSLYDEPDGHALCSLLETLSHSFHVIAPKSWAFAVSTAKTAMKRQFMACGVPTAPFCTSPFDTDEEFGGVPWFVKMDVGASAVGITLENKVTTPDSMKAAWSRVETMGYGVFAEHFIRGRECTVVVCGPVESPTIFAPMERIFKEGLDGHEIDEVWDNYTWETTKPEVDPWAAAAKVLALDAYRAMRATPYARVDIRDKFVLEVNTAPGYGIVDQAYSLPRVLQGKPELIGTFWKSVWSARVFPKDLTNTPANDTAAGLPTAMPSHDQQSSAVSSPIS